MILRHALLAVAVSALSFGGIIVYPGLHPNYDVQIINSPVFTSILLSSSVLNTEFPQWNYTEAPPDLIGYLDPNFPARPIVWTTLINPANDLRLADLPDSPVDTSYQQNPPKDLLPTPEPATYVLIGAGLLLMSCRLRAVGAAKPNDLPRLSQ